MGPGPLDQRFAAALASLIDEVKRDRSILAAVLCGSLSHDTVWAKSDIDLVLVTVDDKKVESGGKALYSDGVNIHALLMPRTGFRQLVEGATRNSFAHSFLTKGRLLYTHDPTIEDLCAALPGIGERDTGLQLLRAATYALPPLYKARKWLLTRGDLEYTALWILYSATALARIEVFAPIRPPGGGLPIFLKSFEDIPASPVLPEYASPVAILSWAGCNLSTAS